MLKRMGFTFCIFFIISLLGTTAKCVTKKTETVNATEISDGGVNKSNASIRERLGQITQLLEQSVEYEKMNFWANLKYYHCKSIGLQLCVRFFQDANKLGKVDSS